MAAETGLYAYALARGEVRADDLGVEGVSEGPLRTVVHEDVCAVVSEVDLAEFGEEGLKRNLEDLAWLERVAVGHDRVARAVAERAPTAPLRLATIFRSEDSVRARIAEWHASASDVFDRIEGRSEWSVKAYADPLPAPERPSREERGSGRDYLMRRKQAQADRERATDADLDAVRTLHGELHDLAVASRVLQPQDPKLSGHTGEMLLNAAYLVGHDDAEAFVARVQGREAGQRLRFTVEGPWPPYSFATLEE